MRAPTHPDQAARLVALEDYLQGDPALQELVAYAAEVCEAPVSLVSAVEEDRQRFLANVGFDRTETSVEESFCAHAMLERGIFEVPDATQDARFADNLLVTGEPRVRFYAGVTVSMPEGPPLGALCVLDVRPRALTDFQRRTLTMLGRQVEARLELRRRTLDAEAARQDADEAQEAQASSRARDRKRLDEMLRTAGVATFEWDVPSDRIAGNDLLGRFYGFPVRAGGNPSADFFARMHPDDRSIRLAAIERALASGGGYEAQYRVTGIDGRERWVLARGDVATGSDGKPLRVSGVVLEVTERVVVERELAEERAHLDRTLATAQVATFDWDLVRDRIRGNALFGEFFGIPSEPEGNPIAPYFARIEPQDVGEVQRRIGEAMEKGGRYEAQYRVKATDGRERWILTRGEVALGADGTAVRIYGVVLDVTERVAAERERERLLAELALASERLESMFEISPSAIAVIRGEELRFEYANEAYRAMVGREDVAGKTLLEVVPEIEGQGFVELLHGVMATGEPFVNPETPVLLRPSADEPARTIYVNLLYAAHREASGAVSGVFVHAVDVTDQVLAREAIAASNEELERRVAERTAELRRTVQEAEGFNYAISHDLRTPLRAVASTSSILLEEVGPELSEKHRALLGRQAHNVVRMGSLIDDLLRLSRLSRADLKRERVDMTSAARAAALAHPERTIEVQEGMEAVADPGLAVSLLQNLVDNACKFSPGGGAVRIGKADGTFFVRDEGVGIDARFAAKIFLPFERLVADDEFPGTGIGLATVKRIVERHGGRIWFESEPGRGATFFFTLNPDTST